MNKVIKLGLLSVALLATVVVNASEKLNVRVASSSSKMLSISLTEVDKGEVVYIKDFRGEVLFFEQLDEADNYTKIFSFSTLPDGLYFVESKTDKKVQSTPIIINKEGVALVGDSAKTFNAPEVTFNGDIMKVLIRNYSNAAVSIAIYDESGILINESDKNTNTLVFGHYDISKLNSESIVISVLEGEYNFVKEVKL